MTEMLIPAKYKDDIDHLVNGFGGLHGLRHRLAEDGGQAAANEDADEEAHR